MSGIVLGLSGLEMSKMGPVLVLMSSKCTVPIVNGGSRRLIFSVGGEKWTKKTSKIELLDSLLS